METDSSRIAITFPIGFTSAPDTVQGIGYYGWLRYSAISTTSFYLSSSNVGDTVRWSVFGR